MKDYPRDYRYYYKMVPRFGNIKHSWDLIGRDGAISLNVTEYAPERNIDWSGGVEIHRRSPGKYDSAPSFDQCGILKAPCWHDGSSLLAAEKYIPQLQGCHNFDHKDIFRQLIGEYRFRFDEEVSA